MKLKKIVAMVLVTSLCVTSLVGCKDSKNKDGKTTKENGQEETTEETESETDKEYKEWVKESAEKLGIKDNDNPEEILKLSEDDELKDVLSDKTKYGPLDGNIIIGKEDDENGSEDTNNFKFFKYNIPVRLHDIKSLVRSNEIDIKKVNDDEFALCINSFNGENQRECDFVDYKKDCIKELQPFKGIEYKPVWSKDSFYGLYPSYLGDDIEQGAKRARIPRFTGLTVVDMEEVKHGENGYINTFSPGFQPENPFKKNIKILNGYAYIFTAGYANYTPFDKTIFPNNITASDTFKDMIEKYGKPSYYYIVKGDTDTDTDRVSTQKIQVNKIEELVDDWMYTGKERECSIIYEYNSPDKTKFAQVMFYFDAYIDYWDYRTCSCTREDLDKWNIVRIEYMYYDKNIWEK